MIWGGGKKFSVYMNVYFFFLFFIKKKSLLIHFRNKKKIWIKILSSQTRLHFTPEHGMHQKTIYKYWEIFLFCFLNGQLVKMNSNENGHWWKMRFHNKPERKLFTKRKTSGWILGVEIVSNIPGLLCPCFPSDNGQQPKKKNQFPHENIRSKIISIYIYIGYIRVLIYQAIRMRKFDSIHCLFWIFNCCCCCCLLNNWFLFTCI